MDVRTQLYLSYKSIQSWRRVEPSYNQTRTLEALNLCVTIQVFVIRSSTSQVLANFGQTPRKVQVKVVLWFWTAVAVVDRFY